MLHNRQVLLASRPDGIPQASHFKIVEAPVPDLRDGEILIRNQFLSVEPAMRGWVSAVANYAQPVGIGEVMRAFASGEVVASRQAGFAIGDKVTGSFGWQDYAVVSASAVTRKVTEEGIPLSASLGIMGLNGITAYFGFLETCSPRPGDCVVVSTAAGSVGSAVGQMAKLMGCRTIGITGGPGKVQLCFEEFGYDVAIDYRAEPDLSAALGRECAQGVDCYFDNTSGSISDAVYSHLATGARITICGTASVSSWNPPPLGPRIERIILVKRARMTGFLAFDHMHRQQEALGRIAVWIRAGQLRWREDISEGLESAPHAIAELYRGENLGKRLIRLHS